jgi:hypothetical protein
MQRIDHSFNKRKRELDKKKKKIEKQKEKLRRKSEPKGGNEIATEGGEDNLPA